MKRIRINGKAQSKFDIAYLIDRIDYTASATVIYASYTYKEMCQWLHRKLERSDKWRPLMASIEWYDNI